ncbi:hypothetical protein B0T37_06305 [Chromobacterium violaceum]|uniref:hypothetical protein n=1 Tax=Chromobacterium violaceum TaxID=536 RepID=UPI0009DA32B8|nr:hypothetical protein [Chromobacterium violaceum]OQS12100.1 hypothetical protein B0T38_00985 [Chromobacterium violaceum]OQS28463.1 hypothetical protein B0T37_06305 [Chromobacterium violaceum]
MNVNIGQAVSLLPPRIGVAGAARAEASAAGERSKVEPLRDINGRTVGSPESRYGLSMRTLQLLKQYDVRNISGTDLHALAEILAAGDEVGGEVAATIRSDIEGRGWKNSGASNALEIFSKRRDDALAEVKAGEVSFRFASYAIQGLERAQQALEKLAAIHDALQSEDEVQSATADGMAQATDRLHAERWMRLAEQADANGEPLVLDRETAESIGRVMQRAGAALPPAPAELKDGAWARQALQAYRSWQSRHPGDTLGIDLKPAAEEDKKVFKEPPRPAAEAVGEQLPQQALPSPQKLGRDALARQQAQAHYGISLPMLQLIKGTDIAGLSIDQLKQYSRLLQDGGVLSRDDAESLLPLTQRGMADPMNYYKRDLNWLASMRQQGRTPQYAAAGNMAGLANEAGRIRNDQQGQAVLERLQALHQALQGDDSVRAVAADSLRQAGDQAAFDKWARIEAKDARKAEDAEPAFRSQKDVDGIFRVLQGLGVELTPMEGDSSPSKRLEQAWQDYRRWQDGHPARHSAGGAVGRGIDAYA